MKEHPILFSGPMVRAILAGDKTQTRRVVKYNNELPRFIGGVGEETDPAHWGWECTGDHGIDWLTLLKSGATNEKTVQCPYGQPGDRLIPAMKIPSLGRNYCADVFGNIWSRAADKTTWKLLKGSPTGKGYLSVTPAVSGKYTTRLVHRLVAEAFYGLFQDLQVRHLDGNQLNNAPENLDWGTQEDNWSDRIAHGKGQRELHHASKLLENDIIFIRATCGGTHSQRQLAQRYGVSQSTIWAVNKGETWRNNPTPNKPNHPRWASRITLEITNIRVERVQEIITKDCAKEGMKFENRISNCHTLNSIKTTRKENFQKLWNSINSKRGYSWDVNPWVWVIEFKVIK